MNIKNRSLIYFLAALLGTSSVSLYAQDLESLELIDSTDLELLKEEEKKDGAALNLSEFEEVDDLESLKNDVGDIIFEDEFKKKQQEIEQKNSQRTNVGGKVANDEDTIIEDEKGGNTKAFGQVEIFDAGIEEKRLLELSEFVAGKIPAKEWDEVSASAQLDKYVVQKGDWLWKISQNLFGSGFYYSKIWSLNPQITNPHEIEPGMNLVFTTGDAETMPKVSVGDFQSETTTTDEGQKVESGDFVDFSQFGEKVKPNWIDERKKLIEDGVYFQFASDETYKDLKELATQNLLNEYQKYDPPVPDIIIQEPGEEYDNSGFDRSSKITFDVKEGFFLNTFVTSNVVQDLGKIVGMPEENIMIQKFHKVYVDFDNSVKVKPGDMFSVYVPGGPVQHKVSDRNGYKYTIGAQIKTLRKVNKKWECIVTEVSGIVQRGDRITVYTPKIGKIVKTFNKRNIEAAVIEGYRDTANGMSFGDVLYFDRGRADGVEMGTVFELYSFYDKGTGKRLTPDPTYKIGEATVISLTDNFATALITNSSAPIALGTIALTKTEEQAALAASVANRDLVKGIKEIESNALDELDVELNLDDINKDLLDKADQVQLTEDELEELERQEREKSIIKDHERDLKELERLESEIVEAEASLNEAKVDEDKFLEQQDLNDIERKNKGQDPNAFESLNDIEKDIGRKFMDEDLNSKENPYGLTEFDLEEIDELLDSEQL
ncbi:MAG: LysM peptidoglycan-binding domain-containing protein [Oligoflexia bacterium]|nr:LysM peptidoglycan-binding domain-containing protein [Oligoflexia bacterium]